MNQAHIHRSIFFSKIYNCLEILLTLFVYCLHLQSVIFMSF